MRGFRTVVVAGALLAALIPLSGCGVNANDSVVGVPPSDSQAPNTPVGYVSPTFTNRTSSPITFTTVSGRWGTNSFTVAPGASHTIEGTDDVSNGAGGWRLGVNMPSTEGNIYWNINNPFAGWPWIYYSVQNSGYNNTIRFNENETHTFVLAQYAFAVTRNGDGESNLKRLDIVISPR